MKKRLFFAAILGFSATLFLCCTDNSPIKFPSDEELRQREGSYSSSSQSSSSTTNKCGDVIFNPDASKDKFCYGGILYDKCDEMPYNPTTQICNKGVLAPAKCGNNTYNPVTQFCQAGSNAVKDFCGTATYTATQFCSNTKEIYDLCGDKEYDPSTQGCSNTKEVYDLCKDSNSLPTREHYGITKSQFCDTRDGKLYVQTHIGDQIWMAENLNYAEGGMCGTIVEDETYFVEENTTYCDDYGRFYDWETAMNGICPSGWHLPSKEEWELIANIGKHGEGTKLKAKSGWANYDDGRDGNGTDDYGFAALPAGKDFSWQSYLWTATEHSDNSLAYHIFLGNYTHLAEYGSSGKTALRSIRCVKNKD